MMFSTSFAGWYVVVEFLLHVPIPLSLKSLWLPSLPVEVAPSVIVVIVESVVVAVVVVVVVVVAVVVVVVVIRLSIKIPPIVCFFLCPLFVSGLEKLSSALSDLNVPVLSPDGT